MSRLKFLPLIVLLYVQAMAQDEQKLADAFIESLVKNNYGLLSPHIATSDIMNKAFYGGKADKATLTKTLAGYTSILKTTWPLYISNAKTENINLAKVKVLDMATAIINKETNMYGLNILYKHADRFGMIGLVYFPYNKKSYLLSFPNPRSAFTAKDSSRIASEIQLMKDKDDPAIKIKVEEKLHQLFEYVKTTNTNAFTVNMVHRDDDDAAKNWKSAGDTANQQDIIQAGIRIRKIHAILEGCPDKTFSSFKVERESEGVWYVYSYKCAGGRKIHFAFLKINGDFLLGDTDVENP